MGVSAIVSDASARPVAVVDEQRMSKNFGRRIKAAATQVVFWSFAVPLFCTAFVGRAAAQTWPDRPLTMVVPFAPGGGTDLLGRIVAKRLAEVLGQQVVVENMGGAGG